MVCAESDFRIYSMRYVSFASHLQRTGELKSAVALAVTCKEGGLSPSPSDKYSGSIAVAVAVTVAVAVAAAVAVAVAAAVAVATAVAAAVAAATAAQTAAPT